MLFKKIKMLGVSVKKEFGLWYPETPVRLGQ